MSRMIEGRSCSQRVVRLTVFLCVVLFSLSAYAGGNDLVLRRLSECDMAVVDGREQCVLVRPDFEAFNLLARDLGLVLSPKGLSPAETLGQAGFEYAYEMNFNLVDSSADHWQRAVEDRSPDDLMLVSQFHMTKGLPFSFEFGTVLSHLHGSDLWGLGAEISWAFHEDFFWPVPDLGFRGFVNNMVGSTDMNLTTAGFDVLIDFTIGLSNLVNFTPYAGYNFTRIWASSRLLDASPEDPSPPIEGSGGVQSVKPEFVFDNVADNYGRFIGGMRFRYAYVNVTIETAISSDVQTHSFHLGLDF